ncbi:hypothetical protein [Salipiger aestuarii]|nr:hypothetical protein [Salipiger aestuarii]
MRPRSPGGQVGSVPAFMPASWRVVVVPSVRVSGDVTMTGSVVA